MYPFKNILYSTDFSPLAHSMLKYAAAFARHYNARLYLHNAQEGSLPPQALRLSERALSEYGYEWLIAVRRELEELAQHEILKDLDVHLLLTEGQPAAEVVRVASEHHIDLALMATQRRGTLERAMMGSTSEAVLEQIRCPVLVSRQPSHDFVFYRGAETTIALNRILFATDFSAHDLAAKQMTFHLAETHKSKVFFMHAIGLFLGYIRSVSLTDTDDIEARVRHDSGEKLKALAAEAGHLESKTILCEGRAYDEVLRVARECDVDLIVIGIGGKHTGNTVGRNAERVIRNANCPVLVVPS